MSDGNGQRTKVVVIGIDGGTFDVIEPMVREGKLPHLGSLMARGTHGVLQSTIPPVTAPAWSTFITGTNPGCHGIFYFFERSLNGYALGGGEKKLVNLGAMKGVPFWRVLNAQGYRVGLVNIPLTYPPDSVEGFMISGMLVPPEATDYVYPPSLYGRLENYSVDLEGLMVENQWRDGALVQKDRGKFVKNVFDLCAIRARNAVKLMREESWDFFMVVFTGSDRISHFFWEDAETGEAPSLLVKGYYSHLDGLVGDILKEAGPDTVKIVLSDHGFGRAPKKQINAFPLMRRWGLTAMVSRSRFIHLGKKILGKMGGNAGKSDARDFIDWKRSKVFAVPVYNNFMGVCINTRGEKMWGMVSPGAEYETLKREIVAQLESLADPETGEKLVKAIHSRETLYRGPVMTEAPDLVVQFPYDYQVQFGPFKRALVEKKTEPTRTGDHRAEGIFIAEGAPIGAGPIGRKLYIQDVTSTLLHLMNAPIPETYDGELIRELFTESDLLRRPPRRLPLEETLSFGARGPESRQDEHAQSKALLESLGYL